MYVMPPCYIVGDTIPFSFDTYDSTAASTTITGLAVTDIEVYKLPSVTQRASDNGYTLVDTDGIDIDGATGFHGFTIDTSDNSDSGFYTNGTTYQVLVNAITVDGVTVRFHYIVAIGYLLRPATAGRTVVVDAAGLIDANAVKLGPTGSGTAQTARDLGAGVNVSQIGGQTASAAGTVTFPGTVASATNITAASGITLASSQTFDNTGTWTGNLTGSVGSVSATVSADVVSISGDSTAADTLERWFDGTVGFGTATSVITGSLSGAVGSVGSTVSADMVSVSGDSAAADNVERWFDGTVGFGTSGSAITGSLSGAVGSVGTGGITTGSFGSGAIDAAALAADVTSEIAAAAAALIVDGSPIVSSRLNAMTTDHDAGTLAAVVTDFEAGQSPNAFKANADYGWFKFFMALSSDHRTPATGLTITATRCIDDGSFTAMANTAVEVSGGWYRISVVAADTNGTGEVVFQFAGTAADTARYKIPLQGR